MGEAEDKPNPNPFGWDALRAPADHAAGDGWDTAAQELTVYREMSRQSPPVADLVPGDKARFGAISKMNRALWREVDLPDGRNGFMWIARVPRPSYLPIFAGLTLALIIGGLIAYSVTRESPKPAAPPSDEVVIRNGEWHRFNESRRFTFWKTVVPSDIQPEPRAEYALLSPEQEKQLLASAEMKAPEGLTVREMSKELRTEPREIEFSIGKPPIRRTFQVKHQEYVLRCEWDVVVPLDFPEGEYSVEVDFKAIPELKKQMDTLHPNYPVTYGFRFRTQKAK